MRLATWRIAAYSSSALLIALLVARQLGEAEISNDAYQITEWRIFYPGHFIRRGLRGSFVGWLSKVSGARPEDLVRWICTLACAGLAVVFATYLFRWLWDKARSWIPILLLSPVGIFFYQNAILSIERFDVFFLLLTVGHLELSVRSQDRRSYAILAAALFSTLGVTAALCHEAFLLLCLPINFMLSSWKLGWRDSRLYAIYALSALAGAFCVLSHVSLNDVVALANALHVPTDSFLFYNGPIYLLALSPVQQAEIVRSLFTPDGVRPFVFAASFFGVIHFTALWRAVSGSEFAHGESGWVRPDRLWLDLLWIPLFCSLPMYVVAADYGRWFVMVVTSFTLCCARLLQIAQPVKKASWFWNSVALAIFFFVPLPVNLRFPGSSPELLTWSGAAVLGRIYGRPAPPPELKSLSQGR